MVDFGLVTLKMTCNAEMPISLTLQAKSLNTRVSREPGVGTIFHFINSKCDSHMNTAHSLVVPKDQSRLVFNGLVQKNQTLGDLDNQF